MTGETLSKGKINATDAISIGFIENAWEFKWESSSSTWRCTLMRFWPGFFTETCYLSPLIVRRFWGRWVPCSSLPQDFASPYP